MDKSIEKLINNQRLAQAIYTFSLVAREAMTRLNKLVQVLEDKNLFLTITRATQIRDTLKEGITLLEKESKWYNESTLTLLGEFIAKTKPFLIPQH